jgi:signal transduction histidine kinase
MYLTKIALGVLSLLGVIALALCTIIQCAREHSSVAAHRITVDVSEDELPCGFSISYVSQDAEMKFRWSTVYDFDGDGLDELITVFVQGVGADQASSVLHYRSPLLLSALKQSWGKGTSATILSAQLLDVIGDEAPEVILTEVAGDSVLLTIVEIGKPESHKWTTIPAAVSRHTLKDGGWKAVHVSALAGVDLNGDGHRDVIFNRSAKPESAIGRAIVAWDLFNDREIWMFELADGVSPENFHVFYDSGKPVFTFTTFSSSNPYEANGMSSQYGYVLSLDASGKELWRRTCGASFFNSPGRAHDLNGDGCNVYLYIRDGNLISDTSHPELVCVDPLNGQELISRTLDCTACRPGLKTLPGDHNHSRRVVVNARCEQVSKLFFFDSTLNLTDTITGDINYVLFAADLVGDASLELIAVTRQSRLAMLDHSLRLAAVVDPPGPLSNNSIHPYSAATGIGVFCSHGIAGWTVFMPFERSMIVVLFARYKWWLAALAGSMLALLIWRAGQTVWRWREAAIGLPTLNHIGSMVLLLDRKGRIIFANRHPITDSLLGTRWRRRQAFTDTELRNQKELSDLLSTSMADPLSFEQQRIEIPAGESSVRLQVTIYPCLDANNVVKGKVVVAESLAVRDDWQWRTVLGESTQRWTHRLKHQLGSARLMLGNVGEDPVVADRIENDPEFRDQWLSIDRQIVEAGGSVTKILRYLRNPKPDLARCDVNDIVKAVSGKHALRECDEVTVSFLPTGGLPAIMGDRDQLCEVIDNLLANARLAINGRGSVTISTRMAEHLLGIGKSEAIDVVIEDTGRGIPETDMMHIWEAGFSRFPGGTGVGLALVREIITNHGGDITASSDLGRGTRFVIRLPVSRE